MLGTPKLASPQRSHSNWKAGALGPGLVVVGVLVVPTLELLGSAAMARTFVVWGLRLGFEGRLRWFSLGADVVGMRVQGNDRRIESVKPRI
jgi:hypothetical protein